jgi:hypothetical protein
MYGSFRHSGNITAFFGLMSAPASRRAAEQCDEIAPLHY